MSERWVIDGLNGCLNAKAETIFWDQERDRLHYTGPILQTGMEALPVQLRWMIYPWIGLPRQPFMIWQRPNPGGNPTKYELANMDGWELLEIVGLPVDGSWTSSGYAMDNQGPINALTDPITAAQQRLKVGAPRIGWADMTLSGLSLPQWQPPNLEAYLHDLLNGRLLRGIRSMLHDEPNALQQHAYPDKEEAAGNIGSLTPHLLLNKQAAIVDQNQTARSTWYPLGLLALSASSDPLAALALGFGTALQLSEATIYMVSVRHRFHAGGPEFELADVILPAAQTQAPDPPAHLAAAEINHTPPQALDGPGLETVGVSWDRPLNPKHTLAPSLVSYPASYVIGRFGPETWRAEILLSKRPVSVGGWLPYVASTGGDNASMVFADHQVRSTTIGNQVVADPLGLQATYAVAAQDIFGRWSTWSSAPFQGKDEQPQIPAILAVQLDPSGALSVDFSWDWSSRSPEFIELVGAYQDDPGTQLLNVHIPFGGNAKVTVAGLTALDAQRSPITDWGAAQDQDPAWPAARYYRLSASVALDFAGKPWRIFQVQARGQCHLHESFIPGLNWNISQFGPQVNARVYDPLPPPAPSVPEAPQWASLPDMGGVSRAVLTWQGDPSAAGYVIYEATETSLLAALGLPGPDTAQPFTERLAVLRAADLSAHRSVFRRVQTDLIPPGAGTTSIEVTLPRGSAVMHFYAVTAMSANKIESAWPATSKGFVAVAAPRLAVPPPPSLEANTDPAATPPVVHLRIGFGVGPAVSQVEIYRTVVDTLTASADTMGPPIATLNVASTQVTFDDTKLTPGWQRLWYRAVAWSPDNPELGSIGGRSPASPAVPVLVLPATPPDLSDLRVEPMPDPCQEERDKLDEIERNINALTARINYLEGRSIPEEPLNDAPPFHNHIDPNNLDQLKQELERQEHQESQVTNELHQCEEAHAESAILISWMSNAPVQPTPFGSHQVIVSVNDQSDHVTTRIADRLDAIASVSTPAQIPAANPNDWRIYRVMAPETRYYAWVPRPKLGNPFGVTVKVIDPLGRMNWLHVNVPAT